VKLSYDCHGYKYEIIEVQNCLEKKLTESPILPLDFSLGLIEILDDIRMESGIYYPMYDHFTDTDIASRANNFSQN